MARAPSQGADPSTGNKQRAPTQEPSMGRKCVFPVVGSLLPVLTGRVPSCFWSLVRFPGPVVLPGSFLFGRRPKYRSFLSSFGRGRRVPAPGGRDDEPDARAPTQAPAPFRYPSTNVEHVFNVKFAYMLTLAWWFSSRSSPSFSSSLCWLSIFPE